MALEMTTSCCILIRPTRIQKTITMRTPTNIHQHPIVLLEQPEEEIFNFIDLDISTKQTGSYLDHLLEFVMLSTDIF